MSLSVSGLVPDFVRPLREVENEFLQVLVPEFRVRRRGRSLELSVAFADDSPSIWLRAAKDYLGRLMPEDARVDVRSRLAAFAAGDEREFVHSDPTFPFRWGNGGTLPVVSRDGRDYYCLFYRDAHPVGWNIANGGANHLHDLLSPAAIIERELREELIVIEPENRRRYIFEWHGARLRDHPDFALAQTLWGEVLRRRGYGELTPIILPLKWVPPTEEDETTTAADWDAIHVEYGEETYYTGRGVISVTAEDFGIEFDRVAKLRVGPNAIFCDGEVQCRRLLDRVVGLFDVARTYHAAASGQREFVPDYMYWNGLDRTGEEPAAVIKQRMIARARNRHGGEESSVGDSALPSFDLCPVTRNVILRFGQLASQPGLARAGEAAPERYQVFVSFASEDRAFAREAYTALRERFGETIFFSDVSLDYGPFGEQIDRALEQARALVLVGTRPEHLRKRWVQYEWGSFHNDVLSARKPESSSLVAFVDGLRIDQLPRPFRYYQSLIDTHAAGRDEALRLLCRRLGASFMGA